MRKTGSMKSMALMSVLAFCLALCLVFSAAPAARGEGEKIRVVTTFFPIYDWTREVIGSQEQAECTLLMENGVDLHSYQPTAADIMKIATCDVFIYVGGESDDWVRDALAEAVNPRMKAVSLMEALGDGVKMEETVEGMEPGDAHGEDAGEEAEEPDEHIWLSLRNARKLAGAIAEAMGEADPDHAAAYRENAGAYGEKLEELDGRYAAAVASAAHKTLLFADRFPFRYLVDDYDLSYYAAFAGCSAETEASFQTIVFLAGKVKELGLPAVMTIEGQDHKIADTVIQASGNPDLKTLTLDSLQGITRDGIRAGVNYLSVMESNLETLREALN